MGPKDLLHPFLIAFGTFDPSPEGFGLQSKAGEGDDVYADDV